MIDVVAFSFLLFIWVGVYIIYKVRGQEREEREYAFYIHQVSLTYEKSYSSELLRSASLIQSALHLCASPSSPLFITFEKSAKACPRSLSLS